MRVAINGVGVAGPALAYWLRRFGHDPVLFEKAAALRVGGYVIDFWGTGYDLAERMGIIDDIIARGYLIDRLSMMDAAGKTIAALDLTPVREQLQNRFVTIARNDLCAALVAACDGIPRYFGHSIEAIAPDHDGVDVTLSDGSTQRFDLVVGADGLHSRVRELAFGPEEQFVRSVGCVVAAFRVNGYPQRDELAYVSHTGPMRQVARVALRQDETLILMICRSEMLETACFPAARRRRCGPRSPAWPGKFRRSLRASTMSTISISTT
jgi:2-polyprenyl-6-methoxyphenol hydroxylase-like FAD-dependent oxidoreductase